MVQHDATAAERFERVILESIDQILANPDPTSYLIWAGSRVPTLLGLSEFGFEPQEGERLGRLLATLIWNATPLPTNGFCPCPIERPEADEPCPCGSGLVYGACCGDLDALPPLSTELIWEILIERLPDGTLRAALDQGAIPEPLLARVAERWLDEDRPGRAVALLEPVFVGPLEQLDGRYALVLELLCDAYDRLEHWRKKLALLQRICAEGQRALQSTAWQRLGLMHLDAAQYDRAHDALTAALRCDPGNPSIALFEIALLTAQGRDLAARERARFWLHRIRRLGLDVEELKSFLEAAVADPQAAMLDSQAVSLDPALLDLHDWIAVAMTRPLPDYRPRKRRQAMRAAPGCTQPDRFAGLQGQDSAPELESASELRPPPDILQAQRQWCSLYPLGKPDSTHLALEEALTAWSDTGWLGHLLDHPELADSLEVLDDLATALYGHPDSSLPWIVHALLLPLLERAWAIIEHAAPLDADCRLPWSLAANRPVLRLLFRRYLAQVQLGHTAEAVLTLETLLSLNPQDHQGARAELMNLYLRAGEDERALELASRFPNDRLADLAYGEVLALYRLGRKERARRVLRVAIRRLPRVPAYLMRRRVRRPQLNPHDVTFGDDDQAWLYREAMRDVWVAEPGVLDWLKHCLNQAGLH
ncbi:hypothetical protein GWK36_12185 [Caldichromatium japonicum]|uniref:Tetratricopeptide repeat protein n=1 Tax=Caldichromatium japonicum TaxID=2699430 RepID=A0A6G7VFG8_9GAMM|nr:SEC-C metal-binding domain-containing protein [Caldichromatium japonicum]QIK38615.1 hypothetical protein GWK36_12185 [Caldichromatium japonicum]